MVGRGSAEPFVGEGVPVNFAPRGRRIGTTNGRKETRMDPEAGD